MVLVTLILVLVLVMVIGNWYGIFNDIGIVSVGWIRDAGIVVLVSVGCGSIVG